jgi:ATP/maltotriose-dependent transcriptional regulator MalT/DNA-binding SARP family transcriptional activator
MAGKHASIAKITRPSAAGIFARKRLFRLLDTCRKYPVIWVTGPAGSGKTTLISSYLEARKLSCLWYQMDEGDSDIATFFSYMAKAVEKAAGRRQTPLPLLTPEYLQGIPTFTRRYFEKLFSRLEIPYVLVFDNYHTVPGDSNFHSMLSDGLSAVPNGMNVIISSRDDPPPALSRLRANGLMGMLGWDELRLRLEELDGIVRLQKKGKTPKEMIRHLHEATEGWAAGLTLILLDLRLRKNEYLSTSALPTREIHNYFAIEIFEKMPKETQEFLLKTTFFPRMTGEMAQRLTGVKNSVEILHDLSEHHYFTEIYLDNNPVYQYHPLFREFLLSKAQDSLGAHEVSLIRHNAAFLLEESGHSEEAAALFRDAEDWKELARLLLGWAQSLILQGRNRTLEEWIGSIPKKVLEATPWLLYWLGVSKQPYNLPESRMLFEQAFRLFQERQDLPGTFLAWSGAVDTIVFEWNDFTLLDHWFEWLNERIRRDSRFLSPDIEVRVASSIAGALLYREPFHPDIRRWMERSLSLSGERKDFNLTMQACLNAVNYYSWMGDLAKCGLVNEEIRKMARSRTPSPLWSLTWKWSEALIFNRTTESSELALKSISEGLEIAKKEGIHVCDHMLFAQGVYASLNKGDMATADEFLKKMETTVERSQRHGLCQYQYLSAWHNLLAGNISRASLYAEKAYELSEKTGMYFTRILCSLLMGQVLYEEGDLQKARTYLTEAKNLVRKSGSVSLEYMCLIREAQFALNGEGEVKRQGMEALRKAMELGRKHRYTDLFPWWQPSVMAHLCARALAEGITVDYAQSLIRKHRLILDKPPLHLENWPWPLKIYTLGKFELMKDDKPVQFSQKVQKKPLLMLKAMIAQGGKDLRGERLSDMLWPEADGDRAYSAFTTTLSRLRQLIDNEKAINYQEGKATIDPRYCWVDAWAFERIFEQIEAESERIGEDETGESGEDEEVLQLIEKGINLYQGHFLADESEEFWMTSYRERLRNKYLLLITRLGNYLQETEQWEKAVKNYQRALEVDNLAEDFYQHLMICYRHLGQYGKAIEIYKRCRKILTSVLGIEPSPKTEAIQKTLIERARANP